MRTILTFLAAGLLAAAAARAERPRIVTTIPPVESVVRSIAGDGVDVYRLLPAGASPHTYEPRPSDLRRVEGALALVYVDRRLDGWAADYPGAPKIALLPFLPDSLLLSIVEEGAAIPGDAARRGDDHDHDHGPGPDPHFWTDPLAVRAILPALAGALGDLDPERRETYRANAAAYAAHLDSLHMKIGAETVAIRGRSVFLSHPFLRYYLRRYGMGVADVIEKIPGKEPTARELGRLITAAGASDAFAILTLPQLSPRGAELLAESTRLPIVVVDPLGGLPGSETYDAILFGITTKLTEGAR